MVLASQSSRQSPRGRFSSNLPGKRSRTRRLVNMGFGIAAILGFGWLVWKWMQPSTPSVPVRTGEITERIPEDVAPPQMMPLVNSNASQPKDASVIGSQEATQLAEPKGVIGAPADAGKGAANPQTTNAATEPPAATAPANTAPAPQVAPPPAGAIGNGSAPASQPTTTGAATDAGPMGAPALNAAIAQAERDPVKARVALTRLLEGSALDTADRMRGYDAINRINGVLVFSNRVVPGDPYAAAYKVESGDSLARIAKEQKLDCDWRLLQRINGIASPSALHVGQTIKLPKGAFHAEVRKGEYRMNMYLGEGPDRVMIASYPIGLGELNTTPTGAFIVRPKSKLIDPEWRNPRTGEFFQSNDPKNPIGERWIGLKGIEPHNKGFEGYGIHGTIDDDSIGQQRSMGCVRMHAKDVEMVYEMLTEPNSTITIAP